MRLNDYSNLRPNPTALVEIPLNGEVYRALPEAPADTTLESVEQLDDKVTASLVALQSQAAEGDEALRSALEKDPALAVQMGSTAMVNTHRAIRFLQAVLLPEDAVRWAANMRPPDPEATKEEQAAHRRRYITLAQVLAVYKDLQEHYSGRPTEPSSSSQSEHDGPGLTSMAGSPAEV